MQERRHAHRAPVNTLVNKYIDGFPYVCEALDLSAGGMLIRRIWEPERDKDFFPLELALPNARAGMWIWTRTVWTRGETQALRFVWMDEADRGLLSNYLDSVRKAA